MVPISPDALKRLAPQAKRVIIKGVAGAAKILGRYEIDRNELRLCHFLAQAAHETAGFRTLVEYGSSRYFRQRYGHRKDLGNRTASDGARYRGRGIFQLTGRDNYRHYGGLIDVDLIAAPQLAARPDLSLHIACEYWQSKRLNVAADANDIRHITRRINGGYNGLKDRQRYFRRAISIWGQGGDFGRFSRFSRKYIRLGHAGRHVENLQQALRRAGFELVPDGRFGVLTRRAVKKFQKQYGLVVDGIAGPKTVEKLNFRPSQTIGVIS